MEGFGDGEDLSEKVKGRFISKVTGEYGRGRTN